MCIMALGFVFYFFFFNSNMGRAGRSTAQGCHPHEAPGLVTQPVPGGALHLQRLGEGTAHRRKQFRPLSRPGFCHTGRGHHAHENEASGPPSSLVGLHPTGGGEVREEPPQDNGDRS